MNVWGGLDAIEQRRHALQPRDFRWREMIPVGRDLLARLSGYSISFIRVPCITADRREVEEWTIDLPATSYRPRAFAVYSPEHVLTLVGWKYTYVGTFMTQPRGL